ncbi:MAG: M66 family metalloprotease, partial [Aeromonas veronii]
SLVSIQVSPSPISIAHGQSQQLVATATYSNGTSADITNTVAWLSTETSVAIVTPGGILMGVSPGSTAVTANFSGVSSNTVKIQINEVVISFNSTPPQNDLVGSLEARVFFAQSQIIPATLKEGDRQPILASLRKSLLLVQPLQVDNTSPIVVNAYSKDNSHFGSLTLSPPQDMPKTVYYNAELSIPAGGVSFTPKTGTSLVISNNSELANLSDKNGSYLLGKLRDNALVAIKTIDSHWTPNIYLPINTELEGKVVTIQSNASSRTVIHNGNKQRIISQGQIERYAFNNGQWFNEEELENNRLTYMSDTWSGELAAEWIQPGLNIVIQQGDMEGVLNNINIGAPGELLLHTIDIGMLTTPRNAFYFANDKEAQRQYFQTIPASRMIISQYAPLYLKEVMLPTGVLLTDFDPSEGGWHGGTMRQRIGKELVSHGINNANYGINSSNGEGEGGHPYTVAQLTAHNSRGKYINGVQVHGGSGGGGIVTIEASIGNEFSHEVGHNYGLGHYVDGFRGSIHRSAENINSSWGWDSDKRRFIPNFFPTKTNQDSCLDNQCQPPFEGRKFGVDAMAGGSPLSNSNYFTFYTPNSASIIQRFFESKAIFDRNSPTGFSKWNNEALRMEPYQHRIDNIELRDASIDQLSESGLRALFEESSLIRVSMWDGRWTRNIQVPAASNENKNRNLIIIHSAGYNSHLFINGGEIIISNGFRKNFRSDGQKWVEVPLIDTSVARVPEEFGVPVTTLIGYYDPQGELNSYIYPALYGAYGFTYPDDSHSISNNDCQLQVETSDGVKYFQLANHRKNGVSMNKFHVNIPTASEPKEASIFCHGNKLVQKIIQPLEQVISFNVYGKSLVSVTSKIE